MLFEYLPAFFNAQFTSIVEQSTVSVDNTAGGVLTDHPVLITLNSGNYDFSTIQTGDDFRLYDGGTAVPIWLEHIDKNANIARLWAKISVGAGQTKNLDLQSGNPSLPSVSNGSNVFPFFEDFEARSYGDVTTDSNIEIWIQDGSAVYASVEAYTPTKLLFYNGATNPSSTTYGIGVATPPVTGTEWRSYRINPVMLGDASGFDSDIVKDPFPVYVNGTYYLFYAGYNGIEYAIGLATSEDGVNYTRYSASAVLSGDQSYDTDGASFPMVVYDPDDVDSAKRWKMWYSGENASGQLQICYAYASVPEGPYTKQGIVLAVGTGGSWDDTGLASVTIPLEVAGTYYMFYGGLDSDDKWEIGYATASSLGGTWTKYGSNPVIQARSGQQSLTAQTNSGTTIVTVADTSAFSTGEAVFLRDTGSNDEMNRISSIDSGTQITLENNAVRNYPTNSTIRSWAKGSVSPGHVDYDGATWTMYGTAFQPYTPSDLLREATFIATSSSPGGPWTYDIVGSPFLPLLDPASSDWDSISRENPRILEASTIQSKGVLLNSNISSSKSVRIASISTHTDVALRAEISYISPNNEWHEVRTTDPTLANPDFYACLLQQPDQWKPAKYESGWTIGATQNYTPVVGKRYVAEMTALGNASQSFTLNGINDTNYVTRTSTYTGVNAAGRVSLSAFGNTNKGQMIVRWMLARPRVTDEPIITVI